MLAVMGVFCYAGEMKGRILPALAAPAALLLLPLLNVSCSQQQTSHARITKATPNVSSNKGLKMRPYRVRGKWYRPMGAEAAMKYSETGEASYYSSGKLARKYGPYYAAHKTLPMPCTVRVTNLRNGRSCECRIADRGPFTRGRIIDVSTATARQIGMIGSGVAPVKVEVVSVGR